MNYVDINYYKNEYGGKAWDDKLLKKAMCLVDFLTHGRIVATGFENLTNFQQENVRRSICLMVDYFGSHGGDVASYGLGDMRVVRQKRVQKPWDVAGCGILAWGALMKTGLMRGSF